LQVEIWKGGTRFLTRIVLKEGVARSNDIYIVMLNGVGLVKRKRKRGIKSQGNWGGFYW